MCPLKTVIIEDEPLARKRLHRLLADHTELIEVIAEADDGIKGLKLIEDLNPDLIFLDVEMPGKTGIEILADLSYKPKIVFTTAYEHYAIKAFEENSVDYLLKPIEQNRFDETMRRLKTMINTPAGSLNSLISQIEKINRSMAINVMSVKIGDRHILIKWDDIAYLEARDKSVFVNTIDGRSLPCDHTLTMIDDMMPDNFCRIHRAFIVNSSLVSEVRNGFNSTYFLLLNDVKTSKIQSSRTYINIIREKFGIGLV